MACALRALDVEDSNACSSYWRASSAALWESLESCAILFGALAFSLVVLFRTFGHGVKPPTLCGNSTHLQVAEMAVASYRRPHAHCNLPPEHSCNSTAAGHHARFASDKKEARIRP